MKKMKKMSKRGLALLMSLLMCMSMLNLTAFADESEVPAEHNHNTVSCTTCEGAGTVDQTVDCPDCDGPAEVEWITCEKCQGDGWLGKYVIDWNSPCPANGAACNGCDKCTMGFETELVTWDCDACGGNGQVVDPNATVCATCGGTGTVTTQADCEACENGQVPCTGAFNEGVLTAVNADGTGTKTFTCETCGASYNEGISAEGVKSILDASISVGTPTINTTSEPGSNVTVSATVTNNSKVSTDVTVTFALTNLTAESSSVTVTAPAEGSVAASITAVVPNKIGESYSVGVASTSIGNASATETQGTVSHVFNKTLVVGGQRMAYWHGGGAPSAVEGEVFPGKLGNVEGLTATFANFGCTEDGKYYGQRITNQYTHRIWQCLGFALVDYYPYKNDYAKFAFGAGFTGGLPEAQAAVTIPYGAVIDAETLYSWEAATTNKANKVYLVAVWYISDSKVTDPSTNATPVPITPVVTETEKPSSTGVTVTFANKDTMEYIHQNKEQGIMHGGYDAQIVITITPDAPVGDVHVNIDSALKDIAAKINALERFEPGDEVRISITVDNQSGREYAYKDRTIMVSTKDLKITEGTEVVEGAEGFDGNKIPSVSNDDFSIIPRRILSAPLEELLGKGNNDTSDESIGAKLAAMGYGRGENLDAAQIAQKYLGTYYLDWTNAVRATKDIAEKASSLQDLTAEEALVFTNGDTGTQTKETSASVAEGLYHFYYGKVFTVNGTSVYDHMVNYNKGQNNESNYDDSLNNQTAGLLTNGVLNLIGTIAGEKANNAFQNTKFGFRVEFDLTVVPTSTPTPPPVVVIPTPTPTPTATPTPTPEPTEEPTPTPEPDEEIPDEDVPLGTPKPEPTPDPDEEIPDEDVPLGTPKPEPTPDPDEEIPDPDVPLGPSEPEPTPEPEEEIPDEDVPLANTPKTGDNADIWFLLSVISAAGLVFLGAAEWKKRKGSHGA